ncbi:MAG: HAMP domain-containing sensor histidine kinase [Clostridia bacterium]|nr:HAMP domain-containing sensor histidine kinase [Clostridia bacterium]
MRRRVALSMILLVLLLFPAGTGMIVSRCFDLTMERERARALSEEAAIARAVALEIGTDDAQRPFMVAQTVQSRYGSQSLQVIMVNDGMAMAGATLPAAEGIDRLLGIEGRATLLVEATRTLYIAHALGGKLMLLLCSDVSPVYALRDELTAWAAMLCAAGVLLSAALAVGISGVLIRPVRLLARAARGLQAGAYDTPLPRAGSDEVGDLTRAFAAMTRAVASREEELREQAQRRQELIDALAHEMRTPLTAIVGGTRLMQLSDISGEQQTALLETMAQEALRLSHMDERLLLLTRLEHDAPEMTAFSSMEMAREALGVFEGVALHGEDARFVAERELTILLLRNLVVNAQRAGGESPVRVTLAADGFSVSDTGCGMTPEQAARAFDPFYKADKARSRSAGGAGLGLTLCRRIAGLHGGTLQIHSEPGKGTTVVYRFVTSP